MLYYLIQEESVYIKEIENATDKTYQDLKFKGFNVIGVFGRSDYANNWKDYYNKKITQKELRNKLELF